MPFPKPAKGESRSKFVSRCVEKMHGEFDSNDQCVAACERTFDNRNKKKKGAKKMATAEKVEMLSAVIGAQALSVDRSQNIIRGVVLAQEGPFKTKGRGAFDQASLKTIKAAINKMPKGMPSRFAHPELFRDPIGTRVGYFKNPQMSHVAVERDGKQVLLHAVRADLHIYKFALKNSRDGGTPYGTQLMDMVEEDPASLSTSLVLSADMEYQMDPATKKMESDANGDPLPPLWRPKQVLASDFVDRGEAVDSALSAAEQLAASDSGLADSEFEVGDAVEWEDVDEDSFETCYCKGKITRIAMEGSLTQRGTDDNTMEAPCAEVGWDDDDDGDIDCWKLVSLDDLELSDDTELAAKPTSIGLGVPESFPVGCEPFTITNLPFTHKGELRNLEGKTLSRTAAEAMMIVASGGEMLSAGRGVPSNPPGGSGVGIAGEWSAPALKDFTGEDWSSLSDAERTKISQHFAFREGLDSFGELHLPHHFPKTGKPSLNGVRNALARLNQVSGMSAGENAAAKAHLESHMPKE